MGGHPHGLFSWTDISVPDVAVGTKFYSQLFGWRAENQTDPDGNYIYTLFYKGDDMVAGMGEQSDDLQSDGVPPTWNSYINVDDVDATVAKVLEHGGSVVMPAMDVMTSGRMAFVADPTGAVVGLWQAGDHQGADAFNEHGTMTWNELVTRDAQTARHFWQNVIGWDYEAFDAAGNDYHVLVLAEKEGDDKFNGGVMAMNDGHPDHVPSHWMVYFNTSDIAESLATVTELGGRVTVPVMETPAGQIAVVRDSQGGMFALIEPQSS